MVSPTTISTLDAFVSTKRATLESMHVGTFSHEVLEMSSTCHWTALRQQCL